MSARLLASSSSESISCTVALSAALIATLVHCWSSDAVQRHGAHITAPTPSSCSSVAMVVILGFEAKGAKRTSRSPLVAGAEVVCAVQSITPVECQDSGESAGEPYCHSLLTDSSGCV